MTGPRILHAQQIAKDIGNDLMGDRLKDGDLLPSLRDLSAKYKVSHETVRRALQILEKQGAITKKHGLGTIVRKAPAAGGIEGVRAASEPFIPYIAKGGQVTIRFETCEYSPEKVAFWEGVLDRFHAANPQVRVQLSPSRFAWPRNERAPLPDVVHAAKWSVAELAAQGRLLNLSPWTAAERFLAGDLTDPASFDCRADPCWGVPVSFDIGVAYLNLRDIAPEDVRRLRANWGLEGIVEWAGRTGGRGGGTAASLPRPHVLMSFCGIDPLDLANLDSQVARLPEALDRLADLHRAYPFYSREGLGGDRLLQGYDGFVRGRTAIAFFHTFMIPDAARRAEFPWAVWPMPASPGQATRCVSLCVAMSKECSCPESAMAFVRFLVEREGQGLLAKAKNNIPVLRAATESAEFLAPPPEGLAEVVARIARTREWPDAGGRAFGDAYCAVWDEEVTAFLLGDRPLPDAADRIATRTRQLARAHGIAL